MTFDPSVTGNAVRTVGDGTVVWGMQLPIQSQSTLYVADWETTATVDDLAAIAIAADNAGCFYLGVCDHTAIPERLVGAMGSVWYDTIATLGWLAGITERTLLLPHVLIISQRHPLRTAKELATLDYLSGGRLVVGVGAGHVNEEFDQLSGDEAFSRRGKDTDEAIVALLEAFSAQSASHHGERWNYDDMHIAPRPVRTPRPPIWIGGSTPAALRRTARYGDGWLPQGTRRTDLPGQIAELRRLRDEYRGGEPIEIGTIAEPLFVTNAAGTKVDGLASYVAQGTPDQLAASLNELVAMGVTHLQIPLRARSAAEFIEQTERFGSEVAPLLG